MVEVGAIAFGEVVTGQSGSFVVRIYEGELVGATKATSCLIEPEVKDIVGLFIANEKYYIVNVLERQGSKSLEIHTTSSLLISSDKKVCIESRSVNLKGASLYVGFENMRSYIKEVELSTMYTEFKSTVLKTIAKSCDVFYKSVVNRIDRSYTYITGHEEVQCESSRHISEEGRVVHCKDLVATAKDQMKLDAEKINLA